MNYFVILMHGRVHFSCIKCISIQTWVSGGSGTWCIYWHMPILYMTKSISLDNYKKESARHLFCPDKYKWSTKCFQWAINSFELCEGCSWESVLLVQIHQLYCWLWPSCQINLGVLNVWLDLPERGDRLYIWPWAIRACQLKLTVFLFQLIICSVLSPKHILH